MPVIRPLITVPTTRPRIASGAICAASGTSICKAEQNNPMHSAMARNTGALGAAAAQASDPAVRQIVTVTRRRLSTMSPSGTRNSRPST